jgi:hypothetical protein
MNHQRFNGFDEMGGIMDPEAVKLAHAQQKQMWDEAEQLIHKVFKQSPNGKKLLATWQKALIMTPTVTPNSTQFQAGIAEGEKSFIRGILLTIDNVEKG